jgi:choline dehydrogenase
VLPDAEVADWLRAVANTEHHPTSTCRTGTDEMAVTDGVGRVRGVEHLRIVDGSILPRVPSGNVNAQRSQRHCRYLADGA